MSIDFEWEYEDGLRHVSDKMLEACLMMLSKCDVSIKQVVEKDKNDEDVERIVISTNIKYLCDEKYTEDDLLNAMNHNYDMLDENTPLFKKDINEFTIRKTRDIKFVCEGCKFQRCPKHIVGYLYYLKEKGLLEEKLKDREEYRKNNQLLDEFDFIWDIEDELKIIPDNVYNFAYQLVDKGLVDVSRALKKRNSIESVKINSKLNCDDYKKTNLDINKVNLDVDRQMFLEREVSHPSAICRVYSCRLPACPWVVAGMIYYCKKIGREDILQKCRDYYHEHQEESDKKMKEIVDETLKNIDNNKNEALDGLEIYRDKIKNLDDLKLLATNKQQNNLHCTIEGEQGVGKFAFVEKLAEVLYKVNKIDEMSDEEIESKRKNNIYTLEGSNKVIQISMHNMLSMMLTSGRDYENYYGKLDERRLYLLTDIDEFLYDCGLYKNLRGNSGSYNEVRYKQIEYFFDEITSMFMQNYVVICGTEKEVDRLIDLDPRMKFVFGINRFKIPNISYEELFEIYMDNIKAELIDELRNNYDNYKRKFIEYVSLNEKFLPFSNGELAKYLAAHSNAKDEIVFPDNVYKRETVEEALKNIVGLSNVKDKMHELENYMLFQIKAKAEGIKLHKDNLHMIFTGNPGTGKTTVARIMAKMLYDLGIIKENKLVEVERKDLVGQYIGQTAPKTSDTINSAMGGVLFIDEAYSLVTDNFGDEAISTLIKAMEDHKDNLVVIFAGYKDEMKKFIDSNPGISSRIGYTFDFPDYTTEELVEIYNIKMKNTGFEISDGVNSKLQGVCKYFSRRKSFGNGRFVDKLVQETIINHAKNNYEDIKVITEEDIPSIEYMNNQNNNKAATASEELENLIGMEQIKEKMRDFEGYVKYLRKAEQENIDIKAQNMHMIYTGNPGTGKTTVARIVAKMLFECGMIHENKLIEVERKDLVAEYVGQTATKTTEVIEKAMGGVLFIDEAYSLTPADNARDFGQEAISTLIKAMEDHKDDLVVIFAGYKEEMKRFVDSNSGIASRIGYTIDFPDYSDEELVEILCSKIKSVGMEIDEDAIEEARKIMKFFYRVENIGNGRFADKVFQEIIMKQARKDKEDIKRVTKEDIPSVNDMTKVIYNGQSMINPEEITDEDQKNTATHETGHAVVRLLLFKNPGIKKITINAEGAGTLGYVEHNGMQDHIITKSTYLKHIKVCLAGMAAEKVYFGEFSSGNTSDLEKATRYARNMITRYGMSDLGLGQIKAKDGEMEKIVQTEINKILDACFKDTIKLIKLNRSKMDRVIDYLFEHKEINEEELISKFNGDSLKNI